MILAIETSCDDTCAAVVDGPEIRANVISSQAAAHERYGGVVPEVASRHHLELINPVVEAALAEAGAGLAELDAVAVTRGPGLVGALLVGVSSAKALAAVHGLPMVGVDHLHGHVAANFLAPDPLEPPFLCLVASGGHTLLAGVNDRASFEVLGQTLDDAAGEALDKGARLLGLGYPGGPAIQALAESGDPEAFGFPVAMARNPGLDFSFSGLKTATLRLVESFPENEVPVADIAAAFQESVADVLSAKAARAADEFGVGQVAVAGGVAANSALRAMVRERVHVPVLLPPLKYCTDNAAMIASVAHYRFAAGQRSSLDVDVLANWPVADPPSPGGSGVA